MSEINLKTLLKPLRDCYYITERDPIRTIKEVADMVLGMIKVHGIDKVKYGVNEFAKEYSPKGTIFNKSKYLNSTLERIIKDYETFVLYDDVAASGSGDPVIDKFDGEGLSVEVFLKLFELEQGRKPTMDEILQKMRSHSQNMMQRILRIEPLTEEEQGRLLKNWNESNIEEMEFYGYTIAEINKNLLPTMEEPKYGSKGI